MTTTKHAGKTQSLSSSDLQVLTGSEFLCVFYASTTSVFLSLSFCVSVIGAIHILTGNDAKGSLQFIPT